MKFTHPCVGFFALILVSASGIAPAPAELPSLNEAPWLGHFLAYGDKKFTFGVDGNATGKLTALGKSGNPVNQKLVVTITFFVEEVLPDGRAIPKTILPESLETKDAATAKPGKVTFNGKVIGDATFEAHIDVEHGEVSLGGRVLQPGTLTKNPLRFAVRANFPNSYPEDPKASKKPVKDEKKAAKALEKQLKEDKFTIVWTDGKRVKMTGGDKLGPESKEINGPGIAQLKVEVASYQGRVFEFSSAQNSKMKLWNPAERAFHEGFLINWHSDPAKDPEGKSRLTFGLK